MARLRQIIETITCDVCGQATDEATAVTLGWGREQWELDLCATHHGELRSAFDGWTSSARRVTGGRARAKGAGRGPGGSTGDIGAVREWAKANGFKVGAKGRISAEVRDAYTAANR